MTNVMMTLAGNQWTSMASPVTLGSLMAQEPPPETTCCSPSAMLLATGQCNVFLQGDHGELAVLQWSSKPWHLHLRLKMANKLYPNAIFKGEPGEKLSKL